VTQAYLEQLGLETLIAGQFMNDLFEGKLTNPSRISNGNYLTSYSLDCTSDISYNNNKYCNYDDDGKESISGYFLPVSSIHYILDIRNPFISVTINLN